MRVFVAGATGAIGRRLVPLLVERGHEVTGMTRSSEKTGALRGMGSEPALCDVFDADALREVVVGAAPEVVVHELTDLPPALDPRKLEEQTAGNDRIREDGTRNLVTAARAAGARRIVAQSIAFAYAPTGEPVKTEADPLFDDAAWPWSRSVTALHALEDAVAKADGLDGLVLRYGWFYGPGTSYASDGRQAQEVRRRRFPVVGTGTGVFSFVHVDDAAAATVAAIERGAPGIYNVVDDEPARMRDWLPVYAQAIGAKRPWRVPVFVARLAVGRQAAGMATGLRGASNARAKEALGWQPRYPSWRQGFREALG